MKIKRYKVYQLNLPFSLQISHSLADRVETEAVIVELTDEKGINGYGEGTPRHYVTGETFQEAVKASSFFLSQLAEAEITGFSSLLGYLQELGSSDSAGKYPAAWCAVELACLDLFARRQGVPLWQLFSSKAETESFTYSAVLPLVTPHTFESIIPMIRTYEMKFIKAKVENSEEGIAILESLRAALGPEIDIRVDANCAFDSQGALDFLRSTAHLNLSAFEQPLPKEDLEGMAYVTAMQAVPLIADESFCSLEDALRLREKRAVSGLNIRLSKCGGFLKSHSIMDNLRESNFFFQIGCHVGETAILSAAGRHLAALHPEIRFLEGSFSTFLLKEDVTGDNIVFGHGGKARLLKKPGLGIDIQMDRVRPWSSVVASA